MQREHDEIMRGYNVIDIDAEFDEATINYIKAFLLDEHLVKENKEGDFK